MSNIGIWIYDIYGIDIRTTTKEVNTNGMWDVWAYASDGQCMVVNHIDVAQD